MFVEEVVKVFVSVVDTQLLEAVLPEVLEPEDVQDGDDVLGGLPGDKNIHKDPC